MIFERYRYFLISAAATLLFFVGIAAWLSSPNASQTPPWSIFVTNFTFFIGITQGALSIALVLRLAKCEWARPFYRLSEVVALSFLPIGLAMLLNVIVGGGSLFFWTKEAVGPWLNLPFFALRNVLLLAVFYALALTLFFSGMSPDPYEKPGITRRIAILSVALLSAFVLHQTVMAWDLSMTLTPGFVSSIFPVGYWVGYLRAGLAALLLIMVFLKTVFKMETLDAKGYFNLANILLGLTVLWLYFWWADFFPVWYANLPEETAFLYTRIFGPYRTLYALLLSLAAAIPFVALLFKRIRSSLLGLSIVSAVILAGIWIERYLTVAPALIRQRMTAYTPILGLTNIAIALGITGGLILLLLLLLRLYPQILSGEEEFESYT